MSLPGFQRQFCLYLRDGADDIVAHVRGDDARTRLTVYHDVYRKRLQDCLRDTYERVRAWLGDAEFDAAALRHIERSAPVSWTLSRYGEDFEHTLRGLYPGDDEVPELAWLDWALHRAFDGPDAAREPLPDPDNVDWDRATFRLLPTLRWRTVSSNCAAIWTALSRSEPPPRAAPLGRNAGIRVWRADDSPRFRSIDAAELDALRRASDGASFGAICDNLAAFAGRTEMVMEAGRLLASWLQDGLITAIET